MRYSEKTRSFKDITGNKRSPKRKIQTDVVIIGGGVAGLFTAYMLAKYGKSVVILEKDNFGSGASTKNEGWLHYGTYHAQSKSGSTEVARRCIVGHDYIRNLFAECLQEVICPSIAVTFQEERIPNIEEQWRLAGVEHEELRLNKDQIDFPEVNPEYLKRAWRVKDTAVNTPMLYSALLKGIQSYGGEYITNVDTKILDSHTAIVSFTDGSVSEIESDFFIYTAGYGNHTLIQNAFDLSIPVRCWKSHLLIYKRLAHANVFCIDTGEVGMMNHSYDETEYSIVGMNEDAEKTKKPCYQPVSSSVEILKKGVARLFLNSAGKFCKSIACCKLDIQTESNLGRDLNIKLFDLTALDASRQDLRNHICAWPGKMTEAPVLAMELTRIICNKPNNLHHMQMRPCDQLTVNNDYSEITISI